MGRRGRPPSPGKVYYLGRLRYRPGIDPPELRDFLEELERTGRKAELLRAALVGGLARVRATRAATEAEDEETSALLDGLLSNF